jgi:hypothetical protein
VLVLEASRFWVPRCSQAFSLVNTRLVKATQGTAVNLRAACDYQHCKQCSRLDWETFIDHVFRGHINTHSVWGSLGFFYRLQYNLVGGEDKCKTSRNYRLASVGTNTNNRAQPTHIYSCKFGIELASAKQRPFKDLGYQAFSIIEPSTTATFSTTS